MYAPLDLRFIDYEIDDCQIDDCQIDDYQIDDDQVPIIGPDSRRHQFTTKTGRPRKTVVSQLEIGMSVSGSRRI